LRYFHELFTREIEVSKFFDSLFPGKSFFSIDGEFLLAGLFLRLFLFVYTGQNELHKL